MSYMEKSFPISLFTFLLAYQPDNQTNAVILTTSGFTSFFANTFPVLFSQGLLC